MTTIRAIILVKPTAKGRPKGAVVNGRAQFYTPAKTRNAEAQIIADIRHQLGKVQAFGAGVPVYLWATFYRPRPGSLPKRVVLPVKKPDYDNYAKLLGDALEGFAFPNDSQITTALIKKRFTLPGETPRIEMELKEDIEI